MRAGLTVAWQGHRRSPAPRPRARMVAGPTGYPAASADDRAVRRAARRRPSPCKASGAGSAAGEHQASAFGADLDRVPVAELAGQDLLRQRVLQLRLDGTLERTGAVDRVEADVAQQLQCRVRQLQ